MWAPYQAEKASLYRPFGPADRLLVFKRIFMADTMYAGPAKVSTYQLIALGMGMPLVLNVFFL